MGFHEERSESHHEAKRADQRRQIARERRGRKEYREDGDAERAKCSNEHEREEEWRGGPNDGDFTIINNNDEKGESE